MVVAVPTSADEAEMANRMASLYEHRSSRLHQLAPDCPADTRPCTWPTDVPKVCFNQQRTDSLHRPLRAPGSGSRSDWSACAQPESSLLPDGPPLFIDYSYSPDVVEGGGDVPWVTEDPGTGDEVQPDGAGEMGMEDTARLVCTAPRHRSPPLPPVHLAGPEPSSCMLLVIRSRSERPVRSMSAHVR